MLLIFAIVVSCFSMTSISCVNASENENIMIYNLEKADDILKEYFSKKDLQELEAERKEQDRIEAVNGFVKRTTEVVISKPMIESYSKIGGEVLAGGSIYYVNVMNNGQVSLVYQLKD